MVVGDTEVPPKCLAGVHHQLLSPQWHIRGEVWSRLDCGLEVLHVSPPWVENHVHDQIRVVGWWKLACGASIEVGCLSFNEVLQLIDYLLQFVSMVWFGLMGVLDYVGLRARFLFMWIVLCVNLMNLVLITSRRVEFSEFQVQLFLCDSYILFSGFLAWSIKLLRLRYFVEHN